MTNKEQENTQEKSLAVFVSELREKLGLSQTGLAKKSALPLKTIEEIESGQELFLASTIRQKLAQALRLKPSELKHYEKNPNFYRGGNCWSIDCFSNTLFEKRETELLSK